jgi:hypothetical protein
VRARNDPDSFTCGHVLCDYVIANPDFAVASALPVSGVPEAARHLNNELILHLRGAGLILRNRLQRQKLYPSRLPAPKLILCQSELRNLGAQIAIH